MKSFFWKFVICIVPVVLACWIIYAKWPDGFKWGVDLSGGTILVYEIDTKKLDEKRADQQGKGKEDESNDDIFKRTASDLAMALKRRIDPTATYNIIIRPAGSEGRVEIILPTGGVEQDRQAEEAWQKLLDKLAKQFQGVELNNIRRGQTESLVDTIQKTKARETWETKLFAMQKQPTPDQAAIVVGVGAASLVSTPAVSAVAFALTESRDNAAWDRLMDRIEKEWVQLSVKNKGDTELPISRIRKTPVGDVTALETKLAEIEVDTPQAIKSWIRRQAWEELIQQIVDWPELQENLRAEVKKESKKPQSKGKKLDELFDEKLKQLHEDLKLVPVDSFEELVGRVETRGDVIAQAALDSLESLMGRYAGQKPLAPREKITEYVTDRYGPSEKSIKNEIAELQKKDTILKQTKRNLTAEKVQEIKDLVSKVGALEFRILANSHDDKQGISEAELGINSTDPIEKEKLKKAAEDGSPPPAVRGDDDKLKPFPLNLPRNYKSWVTYSWVELGKPARRQLGLNNAARVAAPGKRRVWEHMNANANKAVKIPSPFRANTFIWQGSLFYRRECLNRYLPEEERQKKKYEYFVLTRNPEFTSELAGRSLKEGKQFPITGEYLSKAYEDMHGGSPQVAFHFNTNGASLFGALTRKNVPSGEGSEESKIKRHLAIILDGKVMSAPTINSEIRDRGVITGDFTRHEVRELVKILRAGALPATLKPEPVSESTIGALLGRDTIYAGRMAITYGFVLVLVFMVVYYRFAGMVACIALFANLVLTVGFMVAVNATFTLPGLAGLVLMLGMAVDANVLIYERLREERDRGASLALAIRNGYERAFPTIIDTHLSSIFTAIVLYAVGNDQLKGFGISLTVGLIISLFTSLFMTRLMFDFWQAKGWLWKLSMFRLFSNPNLNFMKTRHIVFSVSVTITLLGLLLFLVRAPLGIDFQGGTAFTAKLANGEQVDVAEFKIRLEAGLKNNNLLRIAKNGVKQTDKIGREFDITYENPKGTKPATETYKVKLASTPEDPGGDPAKAVAKRAGALPDWSVEQLFPSKYAEKDPTKSRFFTIRTAEMERELVAVMLDRLLRKRDGGDGWQTLLHKTTMRVGGGAIGQSQLIGQCVGAYSLAPISGSIGSATQILVASKIAASDTFELRKAKEGNDHHVLLEFDDFTSPSFVQSLLKRELQDKIDEATNKREQDKIDEATNKLELRFLIEGEGETKASRFKLMKVTFADLKPGQISAVRQVLSETQTAFNQRPQPERLENFDSELAADTRLRALGAIFASWLAVVLYLWFRFGNWTFGMAAVLCLVHDLCFTLGLVALSAFLQPTAIGAFLKIDDFKIDLTAVAALLTLVGYSVADTIVVFDRIREVRGKNPELTPEIVNSSVNQTLSRTVLTSGTTFLVVATLYWLGGSGIHLFAFIMTIGVFVGTFSSIYIASPLLLMLGEGRLTEKARQRRTPQTAEATV